ncbi:hypothetical protein B0T22DRAFT_53127 [Podospora appendiculata]|uniref:Uncharacterized protein n=1 Tax=Podospora appendiculata TaxID=314037 RepID=A0AAE0XID1_9PEZI|nr:hypothetical protein B0T22DRAFT_53127 [Podospora appendiculata]
MTMTMPGLTVATNASVVATVAHGAASNPPPLPTTSSRTSRSPSPTRPPMSPITPTLAPAQLPGGSISTSPLSLHQSPSKRGSGATPNNIDYNNIPSFAQGRPTFTHSQPDQVGIPPPPAPPEPIAFDDNPDVLALKSAITILQLQRARATADMQALSRAKVAAIENPAAFVTDLAAGRVGMTGDPLLANPDAMVDSDSSSLSSSSSEDSDSEAESESEPGIDNNRPPQAEDVEGDISMTTAASPPPSNSNSNSSSTPATTNTDSQPIESQQEQQPTTKRQKGKRKSTRDSPSTSPPPPPTTTTTTTIAAWRKLPKPQTVVRCPPVNWAQYGVIGESLDKLHAEQIAAPTPGAPTVLGPGGTYEFKAGPLATGESGKRLVGIAAAYMPGRDKIDKKTKGGKR